ncbi:MAG: glycosyltransferase family 4 protein [Candidatus Omnitrophica bacterium]|nr:glycosyltransferase family 4 protein [Candidatus Omnitrophota bacterium]
MKILISLTYYKPYTSGVITYIRNLAEALVRKGHEVTVLTSQYESGLPRQEVMNGVHIHRIPVAFRISKGAIMPRFPMTAFRLLHSHDVAILNLPNTPIEAFFFPILSRLLGRRLIAIHHCGVILPPGIWNKIVEKTVMAFSAFAQTLADRIVCYTEDYAAINKTCRMFPKKLKVIPPPVAMARPDPECVSKFRLQFARDGDPLIGFAGRMATEKGVEHLALALPRIQERFPKARVVFAGEEDGVIGEEKYRDRLRPLIKELGDRWVHLGVLEAEAMNLFYAACDLVTLPSTNSTESFGFVQVESMLCGTPVVASDIPGVRVPVQTTGMGRLVQPANPDNLAATIVQVLQDRSKYLRPREEVENFFSIDKTADAFEHLLSKEEIAE